MLNKMNCLKFAFTINMSSTISFSPTHIYQSDTIEDMLQGYNQSELKR